MNFDKFGLLHSHQRDQGKEEFHHPKKFSHALS
jgi:hypothetical protein